MILRTLKHLWDDEAGSALAYVLVVMIVVFMFVSATILIASTENEHAVYQTSEIKSYYLARAGAEAMAKELKRMSSAELALITAEGASGMTATASSSSGSSSSDILNGTGNVQVTVTNPGGGGDFLIRSFSTLDGHTEEVGIWMSYSDAPAYATDYAAYSKESMTKSSGGNINIQAINGSLASGDEVKIHNNDVDKVSGAILYPMPLELEILDLDLSMISDVNDTTVDLDALSTNADYTISDSCEVLGDFGNNGTLTVNTTNGNYERIEDLDAKTIEMIENNSASDQWMILYFNGGNEIRGTLEITGNKNLMIIVEGQLDLQSLDIEIDPGIYVKCYILDDGDSSDDLNIEDCNTSGYTDSVYLEFILYGADASADLSNNGTIFAKFYAGEGTFKMSNGNTVLYGSIFAKEVELSAQSTINFQLTTDTKYTLGIGKAMDVDHWME